MITKTSSRVDFNHRPEAGGNGTARKGRRYFLMLRCATAALVASVGGAAMVLPVPVLAQSAADTTGSSVPVEAVVVTASRIERNGFQAPTPTTVIGVQDIEKQAQANIADVVNELPQLSGSASPQSTGATIGGGIGGANVLNLRSLGTSRTLVLLDGRRVVGAAPTGVVDVNLIPQALVKRVDVVTGGASAAWGSDAVGGVVNFVLDTEFTGLKGELQGGQSDQGDATNYRASLTGGTTFAGGRGHLLGSVFYSKLDGVNHANSRSWYNGTKMVQNPAWAAGNGQPYYIITPHVGLAAATAGGLVLSGPLKGEQFNPDGTLSNFTPGVLVPGGAFQIGGTFSDVAGKLPLLSGLTQTNAYGRADYDFSEDVTGFLELQYGRSRVPYLSGNAGQAKGLASPPLTVRSDNAYLPAAVRAILVSSNTSSFLLGRANLDCCQAEPVNQRQTYRAVVGLNGRLPGDWKWNAYYEYGRTTIDNDVYNDTIKSRRDLAEDAVVVTAANVGSSGLPLGTIACRSTLAYPSNGCVPMNVFGEGAPSAAALAWINGHAHQSIAMQETVASAQVNGTAFRDWAGPVSVAAGVETRSEQMVGDADPISQTNAFFVGNYHPLAGKYRVTEGFFESDIPLAEDLPLVKYADLDGAVRVTNYSTSGSVATWKLGLNWNVTEDLRLRANRSRDIRAPNLNELFLSAQSNSTSVIDPVTGGQVNIIQTTSGNPSLTPEIADSWGAGIVYQPSWLPGFEASVDYYDIEIQNAIAVFNVQNIVNNCFNNITVFCPQVTRTNGVITGISTIPINAQSETERGFDIEASYRRDLDDLKLPGSLAIRALVANIQERTISAGGQVTNLLGEIPQGGPSRWRGMFVVGYNYGPSSTALTVHYVGGGVIDNSFVEGGNAALASINRNKVDSVTYLDATETYDLDSVVGGNLQAFIAVQNIFNTPPPVATYTVQIQAQSGTTLGPYDLIGRQYRVGIRFRF